MSSATYRTLLRAPGTAAFFLTAAVGRVGIAMTSLGIVWLDSASSAGLAGAAAVAGWAVDNFGARSGFAMAAAAAGAMALLAVAGLRAPRAL